MSALMLLANANVDSGQGVSILAEASPSSDVVSRLDTIDQMLELVHYDAVATVMRQCDDQSSSNNNERTISSNSASLHHSRRNEFNRMNDRRNSMTKEQIRHAKNTNVCNRCGSYGNCYNDHCSDGTLHEVVVSSRTPIVVDNNKSQYRANDDGKSDKTEKSRSTITLINAALNYKAGLTTLNKMNYEGQESGPLVDSGVPYSSIGLVELNALTHVTSCFNAKLDDILKSLKNCSLR